MKAGKNKTENEIQNKNEELFEGVFNSLPVGMAVWHLENPDDVRTFRLVAVNAAATKAAGIEMEQFIGKTMAESFPAVFKTDRPQQYAEVIRSGIPKDLGEARYGDEHIPESLFSVRAFPLPNHCVGIMFENATKRDQMEEKLKRTSEELREAQQKLVEAGKLESVGRFAAGAAHQIKNPLAILRQGADYLSKKIKINDVKAPWVLQEINEAVERIDDIIKDLTGYARLSELNLEIQKLLPRVEQALLAVRLQCEESQIRVVKDYQANLPMVRIDKGRIQQALENLFLNAIQAMPKGGELRVRVYAKKITEEGEGGRRREGVFRNGANAVVVEIEDTGPGIPEEVLGKIFEPFFTTRQDRGGAGLGLSITQSIVEMHGGSLEIGNRPKGGAKVTLMLKAQ